MQTSNAESGVHPSVSPERIIVNTTCMLRSMSAMRERIIAKRDNIIFIENVIIYFWMEFISECLQKPRASV